jgi:pimeloyl-ACP methyl ester carboxylesterase
MIATRMIQAAVAGAFLTSCAVSAAPDDGAEFAVPHQRIDIGGRKLNMYCSGEGAPVVVFVSPLGVAGWNWFKVFPEVSRHSRACVYDRAGFGFSDPSPRPGDSANAVDDLHALLSAAAIPGPYLLVGSSYGAMHAQLYAYRYPSEIAGIVLVDGQHEDEIQLLDVVTGGMFAKGIPIGLARDRACAEGAAAGKVSEECRHDVEPGAGDRLAAAVEKQRNTPAYWRTKESESTGINGASIQELHEARQNFADLPVLILARSVSPFLIPGQPQSPRNRAGEDVHRASLELVLAYSPKGEMRVVPDASHLIQIDQPKAVSDAIIEVLAKVSGAAGKGQPR